MEHFVKGSDLPRVNGDEMPRHLGTIHYVYPDTCYKYRLCREKILFDNEIAIFSRNSMRKLNLDRYDVNVEYFMFTNSIDTSVRSLINSGSATPLTLPEATQMHIHLIGLGMVCVFPTIQKAVDSTLFNHLVKESRRLSCSKTPKDYVKEALPKEEVSIYPSFFYDDDLAFEQLSRINTLLSRMEAVAHSSSKKRPRYVSRPVVSRKRQRRDEK